MVQKAPAQTASLETPCTRNSWHPLYPSLCDEVQLAHAAGRKAGRGRGEYGDDYRQLFRICSGLNSEPGSLPASTAPARSDTVHSTRTVTDSHAPQTHVIGKHPCKHFVTVHHRPVFESSTKNTATLPAPLEPTRPLFTKSNGTSCCQSQTSPCACRTSS